VSAKTPSATTDSTDYDVVLVGLGAMGSAIAHQLAKTGARVLGLDRHAPPHIWGSTHGDTGITRLAIGEGPEYVPLVRRSHEIWRELELATGSELLTQCGGLVLGTHQGQGQHNIQDFLAETVAAARLYDIEHEELTMEQLRNRYPQFHLAGGEEGYFEPSAGYLRPERCVQVQLDAARNRGAQLNFDEQIISFHASSAAVEVTSSKATYRADRLVLTAGPWMAELLPEQQHLFPVYRQVLYWFDIADQAQYEAYRDMPVFIWEFGNRAVDSMYGFPAVDGATGGLKIATEYFGESTTPLAADRMVSESETRETYEHYVRDRFPGLTPRAVKTATCLYTTTPDARFVIDRHPQHDNVLVASPCSGHGFKHSAAIGEVLAQLATTGRSQLDVSRFGFDRFGAR